MAVGGTAPTPFFNSSNSNENEESSKSLHEDLTVRNVSRHPSFQVN